MSHLFGNQRQTSLSIQVVAGVVCEDDRYLGRIAIGDGKPSAEEWMVDVYDIHGLEKFFGGGLVSQREVKARIRQWQARVTNDARLVVLMIHVAKGKYVDFVPGRFKGAFVQVDIICNTADIRLIGVCHHSDFHGSIVRVEGFAVKTRNGRMTRIGVNLVKLILRDKEYVVKHGSDLLSALRKSDIVPESVIATRDGEMILEDEILNDGDVVKLIAVISGGAIA